MNMQQTLTSETRQATRPGFTLVELLVVIAIIGTLAALLTVAVVSALRAAREAAVQTDCTQLAQGFDDYTNTTSGGSYPPNLSNQPAANATAELSRHLNKAFSSNRENATLIQVLATGVSSGQYQMNNSGGVEVGITPQEAIVFWLGGFSNDPKYPLSGPSGPSFLSNEGEDFAARTGFDFNQQQLGPLDGNNQFSGRYITYPDPRTGDTRRINLWVYLPRNLSMPYAYFDASRRPTYEPAFGGVAPIKTLKLNAAARTVANLQLANEGKCQILSAGLDDAWGNLATNVAVDWTNGSASADSVLLYPEGPWTGELADTITNFSTQRTLEDSQP
ncbi:type II secretion system protein [Aeoliella mucimassa]|uniref:Major pilin subunit n=1 Tax=Aeoliella mucimassa TaxID=2527972 RepID=A0A518AU52_9BACT|nr:prepilin-type N-terminal cleavage/methylation domain-containing protein [Aeoliella mucimassa]QDU58264.1 hypothetical protein Pan181_44970 [Aeoliella mucimassa]